MKKKYYPIQPFIENACDNYKEIKGSGNVLCIYSGIAKAPLTYVPDCCYEAVMVLSDNCREIFYPNRCRLSTLDATGKIICGIRFKVEAIPSECVHESVGKIVEMLVNNDGVRLAALADTFHYSERYINMIFTNAYGFGPKEFSRIIRFQSALKAMLESPEKNNSEYIMEQEYYDQAHFQKEFKSFSGMTPRQFRIWAKKWHGK